MTASTQRQACRGPSTRGPSCVETIDRARALERAGRDIVHLEKGELDFDTPGVVVDACMDALRRGETRYADSRGLPELRAAVASYYGRTYGVDVEPERVFVTSGSSPALLTAVLAVARGADVVLPDPTYPAYPTIVATAGATPVYADTSGDGFALTARAMASAATERAAALVVTSPANPVGAVVDPAEVRALRDLPLAVISDEVYEALVFDPVDRRSVLQSIDDAIVVNSFSKSFAMTGWRLGYLVVPARLVPAVTRIQQDCFVGANTFVQHAAVAALEHADAIHESWRAELRARRDVLVDGLRRLGFAVAGEPRGAFYVFARLPEPLCDSERFTRALLDATGVAVTSGEQFGPSGRGHVRFSYSTGVDGIRDALGRIEHFLNSNAINEEGAA